MLIVSSAERLEGNDMKEFLKSSADAVYFHNDREEGSLRGAPYLHEEINDIKYRLAPMSFWQVNRSQNQRLIELVSELLLLRGDERVLDAYCGVGSISLQIARQSKKVVGIEAYLPAVTDALHNMQLNGLQNCNFIRGCCEDLLYKMTDVFDAAILDPPRSGCHKRVIGALIKKSIPRILYISCNPASLARDLQLLQAGGYEISQIRLLDMFPHTAHVESIVLMTNSGFKDR
jgi:23S rRNA (uracil1939-C5)-methyltransferase